MSSNAAAELVIPVGTDDRPHHPYGFSFIGSLERCPAARRSHVAAKNLAQAGERGTELHAVLEEAVKQWMKNLEMGSNMSFLHVLQVKAHEMAVSPNDARSVMKIGEEIANYFVNDPGLQVGTEERIDLKDSRTGETRSFGWYDIILILGTRALIIDHKFVRKEVDAAEVNRQGHALAVSAFQTYPELTHVEVLFSMPECQSSRHTFTREAASVLEAELIEILDAAERPFKTLRAGEQCNYCRFRGECPAATGELKTLATGIQPMAVPASFNPAAIKDPAQMALLRHFCAVVEPVIEQVKAASLEMALAGQPLVADLGNEKVEYKLYSRSAARCFTKEPLEVFNHVRAWLPINAFIAASKLNLVSFEKVAVSVLADRLISQNQKPNLTQIGKDLSKMLTDAGLVMQEGSKINYLKRVKSKAGRAALPSTTDEDRVPIDAEDAE